MRRVTEEDKQLQRLGQRRQRAIAKLDEIDGDLREAVRAADERGLRPTDIMRIANVSRPTIYKILRNGHV